MTQNLQLIQMAIRQRLVIRIFYDDSVRLVEPHLLGLNQRGKLTLSAWQLTGGSGVGWRDFIVPNIVSAAATGEYFTHPRPGYNPNDRTMTRILARLGEVVRSLA